jgi:uncharacterized protein (DUF1330 family)
VQLHANIELPSDLDAVRASGASGIGLFRSEFLFMNRRDMPDEDEQYEAYRAAVPAVIARFGGRYLVRGGAVEPKEGEPGLNRVVILEFPDMARARGFYDSADYAPLLAMRLASSTGTLALVEGMPG